MPKEGLTIKPLVDIPSATECWEWIGSVNPRTGYGKKQLGGRSLLAHRWMYESLLGPIPEGMVVNHICGNRKCVNPTHLEIVSQAENCRHGKGTKLTRIEAKTIKRLKGRINRRVLAQRYNVSVQLVSDIQNGRAWKEV